jgi:iron(III) transport system substrate-binding protein
MRKPSALAITTTALVTITLTACSSNSGGAAPTVAPTTATATAAGPTGGGPTEPTKAPAADSPFTYAGADRDAFLAACAAKEGNSLNWYTSLAGNIIDAMIAGFNKEHPDISVDTFRADETGIAGRVAREREAGQLGGDVLELTSDSFRLLGQTGALAAIVSPVLANYSAQFTLKDAAGGVIGVGDRASIVGFGYNSELLAEADVPKTLQDLANPALKGKMSIYNGTTGVRFVGNIMVSLGDVEGRALLAKLADQEFLVESVTPAATAAEIGNGEVIAAPDIFRNHVLQQQDAGNPVVWTPIEPVTANVGYAGVFAEAKHPCTAMLFADFLLGDGGGAVYDKLHYPRPDAAIKDLGIELWVPDQSFDSVDAYQAAYETWKQLVVETFM